MTFHLPPYSYPTTVATVDDDPHFLESLAFSLGRGVRCEAFEHPATALEALRDRDGSRRAGRLIAPLDATDLADLPGDWTDRGVRLRCSQIVQVARNPARQLDVCAVIADYDMPGMDGVSFFRALHPSKAKRILLTGKADERIAVAAFNDGLIDLFLQKHDPDIRLRLHDVITNAPADYFQRVTEPLVPFFTSESFLCDPCFADYARGLFRQHRVIEHYLLHRPSGLLCFDRDGDGWLLLVQSLEEVEGLFEAGSWPDRPDEPLSHGIQPFELFESRLGEFVQREILPCERLASGWNCSFIPAPALLLEGLKRVPAGRFHRHH